MDSIIDYTSNLKNHNTLVPLIQALVNFKKEIKTELQTYSCVHEPLDKLLVFAVTTHAQTKANQALSVIGMDNPVVCTLYTKEHDLLDTPGWKHF